MQRVKPKQRNYFLNICRQRRRAKGQLSPQRRLNLNSAICSSGRPISDGGEAKCQAFPVAKCHGRHQNPHPGAAYRNTKGCLNTGQTHLVATLSVSGAPKRLSSKRTSAKILRHLLLIPTKRSCALAAANKHAAHVGIP